MPKYLLEVECDNLPDFIEAAQAQASSSILLRHQLFEFEGEKVPVKINARSQRILKHYDMLQLTVIHRDILAFHYRRDNPELAYPEHSFALNLDDLVRKGYLTRTDRHGDYRRLAMQPQEVVHEE